MVIVMLLFILWNVDGLVVVVGMMVCDVVMFEYMEEMLCDEVGLLLGMILIGDGMIFSCIWNKLVVIVIGIDVMSVFVVLNILFLEVIVVISV